MKVCEICGLILESDLDHIVHIYSFTNVKSLHKNIFNFIHGRGVYLKKELYPQYMKDYLERIKQAS